jgi:citrate synthase
MFETSSDILNWVLAISILAVAFFICYGLYSVISTFRKGMKIIKKFENIVFKVEGLLDLVKNKVASSASYLYMITELVKKVTKIVKDKRGNREEVDDDYEEEFEIKPKKKGKKKKVRFI